MRRYCDTVKALNRGKPSIRAFVEHVSGCMGISMEAMLTSTACASFGRLTAGRRFLIRQGEKQ